MPLPGREKAVQGARYAKNKYILIPDILTRQPGSLPYASPAWPGNSDELLKTSPQQLAAGRVPRCPGIKFSVRAESFYEKNSSRHDRLPELARRQTVGRTRHGGAADKVLLLSFFERVFQPGYERLLVL